MTEHFTLPDWSDSIVPADYRTRVRRTFPYESFKTARQIEIERERQERWEAERRENALLRAEAEALYREKEARIAPIRRAALARFGSADARNLWICEQARAKEQFTTKHGKVRWRQVRSFADIGREVGLTGAMVAYYAKFYERKIAIQAKRRAAYPAPPRPLGRPIDMGGPRDVWLMFYPSPDPRFDNMEPATGE